MRTGLAAMVLALAVAGGASAADTSQQELDGLVSAMDETGCDASRAKRLTRRKDFEALPSSGRSLAWSILAMCDPKSQQEALIRATAEPDALALAWSLRAAHLAQEGKLLDAVAALDSAVDRQGDQTFGIHDDLAYGMAEALKDDDKTFSRYAAALFRANWKPEDPFYGGDWIWVKQARLLIEAGAPDDAKRVLERVEAPEDLLRVSLDKRFDVLKLPPERVEVLGVTERLVARHLKMLAEHPRSGLGLVTVSMRLRTLGRQQEALDLLDRALASPEPILNDKGQDHRNWVVNERALVLEELGRTDEAIRAMTAASQLPENGQTPNVSQTINLATLTTAAGRYEETLTTLAAFDRHPKDVTSTYGWMWIWAERACALTGLGRTAEAAKALDYTRANAKENSSARLKALLCADDIDGAAETVTAELADPQARMSTLAMLSRFKVSPIASAHDKALDARFERVRTHPRVVAAVEPVGRTRDLPLFRTGAADAF